MTRIRKPTDEQREERSKLERAVSAITYRAAERAAIEVPTEAVARAAEQDLAQVERLWHALDYMSLFGPTERRAAQALELRRIWHMSVKECCEAICASPVMVRNAELYALDLLPIMWGHGEVSEEEWVGHLLEEALAEVARQAGDEVVARAADVLEAAQEAVRRGVRPTRARPYRTAEFCVTQRAPSWLHDQLSSASGRAARRLFPYEADDALELAFEATEDDWEVQGVIQMDAMLCELLRPGWAPLAVCDPQAFTAGVLVLGHGPGGDGRSSYEIFGTQGPEERPVTPDGDDVAEIVECALTGRPCDGAGDMQDPGTDVHSGGGPAAA